METKTLETAVTIRISGKLWKTLSQMKEVTESFEGVIWRLVALKKLEDLKCQKNQ